MMRSVTRGEVRVIETPDGLLRVPVLTPRGALWRDLDRAPIVETAACNRARVTAGPTWMEHDLGGGR